MCVCVCVWRGSKATSGFLCSLITLFCFLFRACTCTCKLNKLNKQHYVPIDKYGYNVNEQMKWILNHPVEAQEISKRATIWIYDLLLSPISKKENFLIEQEILRRYSLHFKPY